MELVTINSETYLLSDMMGYADNSLYAVFDHTELDQVQSFASNGWQPNAGGGVLPTIDGSGNITSVRYAPTSTGNYVPYKYGDEVWHPGVVTSMFFASGSGHMTVESALKGVNFHRGISIDDVRLTLSGSQGDASLVVNLDDFGESFTIPYFETGETINGIALYGANIHSWVQGSSSGTFAGSGGGTYSGTFANGTNPNITGTYGQTFFFEFLNFYNGTINTLGNLTFEGTDGGDSLTGLDSRDDAILGYGGNDSISGYGGNDTLTGGGGFDWVTGGAGNDTYIFAAGSDADYIYEYTGEGTDIVRASGFDVEDVRLVTNSSGHLSIINRADETDEAQLIGSTTGESGTAYEIDIDSFIEQIVFDDATWNLDEGLTLEG
ncbi:MAG: hypothetical protein DYH13_02790, partial [Alphaproteobacteria bacterium PRO2]|nr:hypothetical protein [Alphaproteobacteria bacterium PRO2]